MRWKDLLNLQSWFARAAKKETPPSYRCADIIDMFRLQTDDRYINGEHMQQTVYRMMGHATPMMDMLFDKARILYADPGRKLLIEHKGEPDSIEPPPRPSEIPASAAIMATRLNHENSRTMLIVIRDAIDDPEDVEKKVVFGLEGLRKKDGSFIFKKLQVPAIDAAHRMTGLRNVDVRDKADIDCALAYARLCAAQIFNGQTLTPRLNMQRALEQKPPAQSVAPAGP